MRDNQAVETNRRPRAGRGGLPALRTFQSSGSNPTVHPLIRSPRPLAGRPPIVQISVDTSEACLAKISFTVPKDEFDKEVKKLL